MGQYGVLLMMLMLVQGCAKQDVGKPDNLLNLADPASPAAANAANPAISKPIAGGNATAVMAVARALAAKRGVDPVEIGRFCDDNASAFTSQGDVHACKAMTRSTVALVPVPASIGEMVTIAATLPVKDRFVFCTSTATLKLQRTVEDYDRCFPPSIRAEFEAIGGIDSIEDQNTPVTQEELKEQVLRDAARMTEPERQMYCNVASILATMKGDSHACLAGQSTGEPPSMPLTDDDPGYRDEGH